MYVREPRPLQEKTQPETYKKVSPFEYYFRIRWFCYCLEDEIRCFRVGPGEFVRLRTITMKTVETDLFP